MNIAGETNDIDLVQAAGHRRARPGSAYDVEIYDNDIPDFVAHELERLYESVYCTVARFRIYGEAHGASTYVARSAQGIACVILYRIEGRTVKVINQQITLSAADLRSFADTMFARYRAVSLISFYAIDAQLGRFPYPCRSFEVLEENVVRLPATPEDYPSSLSQKLLKRVQSAERKLNADFPGFVFDVLERTEVDEGILRTIAGLAGARMAAKQQGAYLDEASIGDILRVVHAYGYVGVLKLDGEVRAGNVFYGVGRRYFMHIIAHDPEYDKYMLGHMVQYMAALHCIKLGGKECCLMGGARENKARFGATTMYLSSVDIYRSRLHLALSVRRVWTAAARRWLHQARHDIGQLAKADGFGARLAAGALALLRRARHLRHAPPDGAK